MRVLSGLSKGSEGLVSQFTLFGKCLNRALNYFNVVSLRLVTMNFDVCFRFGVFGV